MRDEDSWQEWSDDRAELVRMIGETGSFSRPAPSRESQPFHPASYSSAGSGCSSTPPEFRWSRSATRPVTRRGLHRLLLPSRQGRELARRRVSRQAPPWPREPYRDGRGRGVHHRPPGGLHRLASGPLVVVRQAARRAARGDLPGHVAAGLQPPAGRPATGASSSRSWPPCSRSTTPASLSAWRPLPLLLPGRSSRPQSRRLDCAELCVCSRSSTRASPATPPHYERDRARWPVCSPSAWWPDCPAPRMTLRRSRPVIGWLRPQRCPRLRRLHPRTRSSWPLRCR